MTAALARADALHERGVLEQNTGHPRRAQVLLARARLALGAGPQSAARDRLLAALAISAALVDAELAGAEAGLTAIRAATERALELGDDSLVVRAYSQSALIALRAGRLHDALDGFAKADRLLPHANDNDQFAVLLNLGTLRMAQGDIRGARRALRRADTVATRAELRLGRFKALHNLGYAEFLAGDIPTALARMGEAAQLGEDLPLGIPLLDRARVLVEAGLVNEADVCLARAGELFSRDRLTQDLGEVELERARCALIGGDAATARRYAARARDRFRRQGNDRWRRTAELTLLEGDLAAGRPGRRLVAPALRLCDELARDGLRLPVRTAALLATEAHLAAGQLEAAQRVVRASGRSRPQDPITLRLHAHYVRARLEQARGHRAAASRRSRAALGELALHQARFGSLDLATAAGVHGSRLAALDLSIALASGRPEQVLDAVEHARAVTSRLPAIRAPADDRTADLLSELRRTVEALREGQHDPAAVARGQQRRAVLEGALAQRGWERAATGATPVRGVVQLEQLRAELGDTVFVSYLRSGGALHAVVLEQRRIRLVQMPPAGAVEEAVRRARADLDVLAVARLPAPIRAAAAASLSRTLAELDSALLTCLTPGTARLVIVSTGLLGQVPWGLLPRLRTVPVVVAPSATSWCAASSRPPASSSGVVAVVGPGLARGFEEAAAVARAWQTSRSPQPARVVTGAQADARTAGEALTSARLVHLAAHGVHQSESPLFSSIRLADGPLFAHELDLNATAADHVVLSACELGLSTVRPGDEALGLSSVLLRLGTRSVVAGVARVGDDIAAHVMGAYHRRLAGGADSCAALADTLAELPTGAAPAPFVCFGAAWTAA